MWYESPKFRAMFSWLLHSRETTNFTYDITERNFEDLKDFVALVTGFPRADVARFLEEPLHDEALRSHIQEATSRSRLRSRSDLIPKFGRRLAWYAMVRLLRPKVVVETGVEKGLGSVLVCSALLKNKAEGFEGQHYGTDIDPRAGFLLGGEYSSVGRILYGDSIESLRNLPETVDLFINDSDHSVDYEKAEYYVIASKLSPMAVIISDNAHATDCLRQFARETGLQFLFFSEKPKDHWYPGGGIGVAVPRIPLHTATST
jgi:predicted O-methyltransferase YrrM